MDFDARIQPQLKAGIPIPRDFSDYSVAVNEGMLNGVTLERKA